MAQNPNARKETKTLRTAAPDTSADALGKQAGGCGLVPNQAPRGPEVRRRLVEDPPGAAGGLLNKDVIRRKILMPALEIPGGE